MKLKKLTFNTALPDRPRGKILIIYTGGTFGMVSRDGVLVPFDFASIIEHLPILKNLLLEISVVAFETPIDSSNINPDHWKLIGTIIQEHYDEVDGFVVLHGTDTMAFTASAISFMFEGLNKPIVFTGAQLPISEPRSDASENLITSLEIASAKKDDVPMVPEVSIFFDYELLRGNRSKKVESLLFDAFDSGNYPPLATAGVKIDYNLGAIGRYQKNAQLLMRTQFETNIIILKLFPGIQQSTVHAMLHAPDLKGVVLETYGSGNAPTNPWLVEELKLAIERGVLIVNISQCPGGRVMQGRYETSKRLQQIGVISGADMTTEAAVTKMMLLLGEFGVAKTRSLMNLPLAGELTP
jgi:L-asparaginase